MDISQGLPPSNNRPPAFSPNAGMSVVIVVLPLIEFWLERNVTGEMIVGIFGPPLYAIYALGVIAYLIVLVASPASAAFSLASGVLIVPAFIAMLLTISGVAFVIMFGLFGALGPALALAIMTLICGVLWISLRRAAFSTIDTYAARSGRTAKIVWASLGAVLAVTAMIAAQKADHAWLAPRVDALRTADTGRWEQALRDIQSNPFCGIRRCLSLTRVCNANQDWGDGPSKTMDAAFQDTFVRIYGESPIEACGMSYEY